MFAGRISIQAVGAGLALTLATACGSAEGGEAAQQEEATEAGEYGSPVADESHVTVPAGTALQLELQNELSTEENQVEDRFTATVIQPIVRDGETAIPAGATVSGRVTAVQPASDDMPAVLKIDFDHIDLFGEAYPLEASLTHARFEQESDSSTGEDAARIGVTTAAGAVIGRVIGGNATGTLVGAAVGAAAGTAIVLGDEDDVVVLERGSELTIRLLDGLTVDIDR